MVGKKPRRPDGSRHDNGTALRSDTSVAIPTRPRGNERCLPRLEERPVPARLASGQRPRPGAAGQPRRQTLRGDRGHGNPTAKTTMRTIFKATPRLPNSAVKVRPTSLTQSSHHQLARKTLGATKERLGKKTREGQDAFVAQRVGSRIEHRT